MRNLITDVAGLKVGHAEDAKLGSGATAIVFDEPAVASADLRGGGPGTRETELLDRGLDGRAHRRDHAVRRLGLRARRHLRRAGLAARTGPRLCHSRRRACRSCRARSCSICCPAATRTGAASRPIASSAIDAAACRLARFRARQRRRGPWRDHRQSEGRHRLGFGGDRRRRHGRRARRGQRGRLASPSATARISGRRRSSSDKEFGGRGWPKSFGPNELALRTKGGERQATTIALVATDAMLTKAQAHRLAVMAQTGWRARSIRCIRRSTATWCSPPRPARKPLPDPLFSLTALGTLAANVLARAIARAVYEATALPFPARCRLARQVRREKFEQNPRRQPCNPIAVNASPALSLVR